jgi:hypothetical protein
MQLTTFYKNLGAEHYQPRRFNARSRLRFFSIQSQCLVEALDHYPTQADVVLIDRICRNWWELLKQDQRLDHGEVLSEHAQLARNAAENRLRYDLRALSLYPIAGPITHGKAPPSRATFDEMLARFREQDEQGLGP